MKESEKGDQNNLVNSTIEEGDPDERRPDPDDPNEEVAMPPKEMPKKDHEHDEEITYHDFVANYDFIAS